MEGQHAHQMVWNVDEDEEGPSTTPDASLGPPALAGSEETDEIVGNDAASMRSPTYAAADSAHVVADSSLLSRVLSEKLDPEISKAVDIVDSLSGFGKKWTGDITGGLGTSTDGSKDPAQSVEAIDDFLSHDWATWGKLKYITLCYAYNGLAASIFAMFVAGVFGALEIFIPSLRRMPAYRQPVAGQNEYVESAGYFGLLAGNISFLVVLFFWQHIKRALTRKTYFVFMDKMCIHQTDPELKGKGILGLAGFLRISDRLVILWSPRYFTRLWCVYEIASWMSQGKSLRKVEINPVAEGSFMFANHIGITMLSVMLVWCARFEDLLYYITMASAAVGACMLPLHIMRRNVRDLQQMPQQIKSFHFDKAECFCCSVNHIIPGTDTVIPCDREVIQTKLTQWFKKGKADPIALFNNYVRKQLGAHILKRVGGSKVRYTSAVTCCISGILFFSDRAPLLWKLEGWASWRLFMFYCTNCFAVFPSILRFSLETALVFNSTVGVLKNPFYDILVTIAACAPTTVPTLLLMAASYQTLKQESWWQQVAVTVVCTFVTIFLYREDPIAWYQQYLCRNKLLAIDSASDKDPFADIKEDKEEIVHSQEYSKMTKPLSAEDAVLVSV